MNLLHLRLLVALARRDQTALELFYQVNVDSGYSYKLVERTAYRALTTLIENGLIRRELNGRGDVIYHLNVAGRTALRDESSNLGRLLQAITERIEMIAE